MGCVDHLPRAQHWRDYGHSNLVWVCVHDPVARLFALKSVEDWRTGDLALCVGIRPAMCDLLERTLWHAWDRRLHHWRHHVIEPRRSTEARPSRLPVSLIDLGASIATLLVLFVGVPTVLVSVVGVPPSAAGKSDPLSIHAILDILTATAWVSWVACCLPLACAVFRRVRGRDLSTATRPPPLDRLAIRIASSILVLGSAAVAVGSTASAAITKAVLLAQPVSSTTESLGSGSISFDTHPRSRDADRMSYWVGQDGHHVVTEGESLSSIAEAIYGESGEWELLARRNLGRPMSSSSLFVDPNEIKPGWRLILPWVYEDAIGHPKPPGYFGLSTTEVDDVTSSPSDTRGRFGNKPDNEISDSSRRPTDPLLVPEFCSIGLGTLGAAAVARRLRRRRSDDFASSTSETADEATVDAAVLVERFQDTPLLGWIEAANIRLGSELAKEGVSADIPVCQLVRASPSGIEFRLAESASWAPRGFDLTEMGTSWNFPMRPGSETLGSVPSDSAPWIPALLPIGSNADGTWLVSIPPGRCVSVVGPSASSLVSSMRLLADSWEWSNLLTVTTDPAVAAAAGHGPKSVLFVGDPNFLDSPTRAFCSVLTTSTESPADVIVVVDERSATLHPFGIALRPNGLDPRLAVSLTELSRGTTLLPDTLITQANSNENPDARQSNMSRELAPVVIRLLTAIPRIDGLQEALSPKRARRATELVAYLALHRPDPVTSDRLRTRVLGTRESDAAAKTLFNTVGAARRALGHDIDGSQLLPPASKSGHYRLSANVGIDVVHSMSLCEAARTAASAEESIGLCRAALSLIEGEPLSGTLSGYSWWRAEGYEARVNVVLVEAACQLSDLAVRAELFELARWGLERGRMIDPYSELLSRSAMELAASSGDSSRLRREWIECQRRVDELDPGCLPSEATTRLFEELSDRLSAVP
jgi:DNA-binding SARP family transcriptional activator